MGIGRVYRVGVLDPMSSPRPLSIPQAVEREKAAAVVPYAESLEEYEDALARQRALLKKTMGEVQTQVARAEAAEAELRKLSAKLSAGGSGARGEVGGEGEEEVDLRDQVDALRAEIMVLKASAARGGAGTTPEDASREVSLMPRIDRQWLMGADMEQARAAALRLLTDHQTTIATSLSKSASLKLQKEAANEANARAAQAEARAAKAEAEAKALRAMIGGKKGGEGGADVPSGDDEEEEGGGGKGIGGEGAGKGGEKGGEEGIGGGAGMGIGGGETGGEGGIGEEQKEGEGDPEVEPQGAGGRGGRGGKKAPTKKTPAKKNK